MTPIIAKSVLAFPLPVRIALLEADPTGEGYMVAAIDDWRLYEKPSKQERWGVANALCAWLPSNPLAVIEVAARILAARHGLTPSIELLGPDGAEGEAGWTCRLVVTSDIQVEAAGSREEIGVLVLREVCRG